jgi:protein TonB
MPAKPLRAEQSDPGGLEGRALAGAVQGALRADPLRRLVDPAIQQPQGLFFAILAICLAAHALILAALLLQDSSPTDQAALAEEIPVEVVAAIPQEQKPEPELKLEEPPPLAELLAPPPVKEKPPPEKIQLEDVKEAFDAPASGNASETRRAEQEKETQGPRAAPPPKIQAERAQDKPEQEKAAAPADEKQAKPEQSSEPQKLADLEPDAEGLDKAQPEPPAKPKEKPAPKASKAPRAQGKKTTVAEQLAALAPAPQFSFGAAAKAAPIGGGSEKASYESLLFGLIVRQLHLPPEARARHLIHVGRIGLFVDELGNLTHQALYLASGDPGLDAAWLAAVKHAAPFPPPPRNMPHGFLLQYSNQE